MCLPAEIERLHKLEKSKMRVENEVILEEGIEETKEDEKINQEEFLRVLIKIQSRFRVKKFQKIYKMMKKKLVQRKYIIEELIKTEGNFKNSLFSVIEKVILPLKEEKILTKDEEVIIFSNLESIANFSKTFHISIYETYNYNYENSKTKFAGKVLGLLPFFKLYFEYCHNFSESMNVLGQIRKNNEKFADLLKNIEFSPEFDFQDLDSQLIKPIQRLPKYVLLFKDLLKNTELHHPDYQNIEKALKQFQSLNNENDKKILQKVKIFELQEKYGSSLNFSILDSQREFLDEESLILLNDRTTILVLVYFFTDLMLVTEQNFPENKLIKHLTFDYNSYVRDMPTTRYFQWCLSIFGKEGGLTFMFDTKELKSKVLEFLTVRVFSEIKAKFRSKISGFSYFGFGDLSKNKQITTEVLGTFLRGLDHIKPYTVYIIEIKYEEILYKIFVRYKELLQLEATINNNYPGLKLDKLPPKHFWTEQKAKTIESRKFHIESFLRSVLHNNQIMQNKEQILEHLYLPHNFYQYENFNKEVKQKNKDWIENSNNPLRKRLKRKKSVYRTFLDVLKNEKRIYYPPEEISLGRANRRKIGVFLTNNERKTIEITRHTKTIDVCKQIAEEIGLTSWFDFRLCLVSSSMDEIIINDQEFLWKALDLEINEIEKPNHENKKIDNTNNKPEEINENSDKKTLNHSFNKIWTSIKEKLSNFFQNHLYCNSQLVFKKVYYLPSDIEEIDYKTDSKRLDLMIAQSLMELRQNRLRLSLNDYCLFASLMVYMKYGSIYAIPPIKLPNLFKNEILPETIPGLIVYQRKWDFWFNNIMWFWKNFSDEIEKTMELNKRFNQQIGKKILSNILKKQELEVYEKEVNGKVISKFVMLNCMFRTSLYGTHRFFVTLIDETTKTSNKVYWLSINFDNVRFLEEKSCVEFKKINYDEYDNIVALPSSMELILKGEKILFYTSKGFEIKEIIQNYKKIRNVWQNLEKKKGNKSKKNIQEDEAHKFRRSIPAK